MSEAPQDIMSMPHRSKHRTGMNASRLRDAIDCGRTGDKIPWPDPAMCPLGTDEEAAGAAPSDEAVRTAYEEETGRPTRKPSRRLGPAAWLYTLFIVGMGVGLAGAILHRAWL